MTLGDEVISMIPVEDDTRAGDAMKTVGEGARLLTAGEDMMLGDEVTIPVGDDMRAGGVMITVGEDISSRKHLPKMDQA